MKPFDAAELALLAALWGASFLFMRMGAGEFGPVALAALRVGGGALVLLPLLAWRGQIGDLWCHRRAIFAVGVANSALPFLAFSFAALSITAGLSSIFNATTPLWGGLIAWLWLGDRPTRARLLGLAIGFVGVLWLAWDKASFRPGADGATTGWAVIACLVATLCYGWAANFTKRRLTGVPPLAVAAGSQLAGAIVLLPLLVWWWPQTPPSGRAWLAVVLLALLCTGVAYQLYFRLIARIGPANAISVTFLIPLFAVLWGWLFLAEALTRAMLAGGAVILVGTALATGVLRGPNLGSGRSVSTDRR